ncbi:MAG: phosphoglycerate kinase [Anaerolineales bacterium]|nr:phosphoglycerate kinase [Anaerolineales bacterium]
MIKKTIRDIDVAAKNVLVRVDFNVPLKNSQVSDDTRLRAALPTLTYLLDHGAALILCSHLGRPKGIDPELSMKPIAERLAELLDRPVKTVASVIGQKTTKAVESLKPGDILLLENTRFEPGEKKNDPELSNELAKLATIYVNDAFGSAHRAHASTEGVAQVMKANGYPAVAGFLMEKEINYLGQASKDPKRPFIAIIGGAKISGKIQVIENLLGMVDKLIIGGGMANTFLKASGLQVGDSLVEDDQLDLARELISRGGAKLVLPTDAVIADAFDPDANLQNVPVNQIPSGWRIMDIGLTSIQVFISALEGARTVIWNGPMGVFEFPRFAAGTLALAQLMAAITAAGGTTIIGGGDSAAAVKQLGLADKMSHVSTGGGASLEFLEGKTLPGVYVLDDK